MVRDSVSRLALVTVFAAAMVGCAAKGPGPLYSWGTFPRDQYTVLLRDGASAEEQLRNLELQMNKANAAHAALPPGFRAHVGLMQLSLGNDEAARKSFESEKQAFPESAPYMDKLLAKLASSAAGADGNKKGVGA